MRPITGTLDIHEVLILIEVYIDGYTSFLGMSKTFHKKFKN